MACPAGADSRWDDEEDSRWDDEEDTDFGEDAEEEEPTIPCPYCRRPIHEESQRCPYCATYLSTEDAPASLKPKWFVLGFLLCLLLVIVWIVSAV